MRNLKKTGFLGVLLLIITSCGETGQGKKILRQVNIEFDSFKSEEAISNKNTIDNDFILTPESSNPPENNEDEEINVPEPIEQTESLRVFKESVFPLVREHCVLCHESKVQPFFAQQDAEAAEKVIIDSQKVDFAVIENSRIYLRLKEDNHNCWSDCAQDSEKMLAALLAWQKLNEPEEVIKPETESIQIVAGREESAPYDSASIIVSAADYTTLIAPMVSSIDLPDEGFPVHFLVPEGNGGLIEADEEGGEAHYTIKVTEAQTFYIWIRVNTLDTTQDSFYISLDNSPLTRWNIGSTDNDWEWRRFDVDENALSFDLEPGDHTLVIKQREELTKFNAVALSTTLEGFNGGPVGERKYRVLEFDLAALTGKNAKLIVNVADFADGSNTMLMSDLRVETDEPLHFAGIEPQINRVSNPLHSNFNDIDITVEAPGGPLGDATLILIGENGYLDDRLSFVFEVIE